MRFFFALFFLTTIAQAACDLQIRDRMFRTPEQIKEFKCELNFQCAATLIKKEDANLDELDAVADYSRANQCNDELRLADLWASLMAVEAGGDEPNVNNADRGNSKSDLPVIPDAPIAPGSRVQRQ